MSNAVEMKWTIKAGVSAFVLIALASFCVPSLQTFYSSTTGVQHHRQQFNDKGKVNFCVLAKSPTKLGIRKSSAQQLVQLFCSVGEVSLRRINFPAHSVCLVNIHSGITRGSLTLRERAPPV